MNCKIKFLILILSAYFPFFSANAVASAETARMAPATTWEQARNLCRELGPSWDLPTVSDITTHAVSIDLFAKVLIKNLKSQQTEHYNLIWVRSDEEQLNQQFIKLSQALKYINQTGDFDAYILDRTMIARRANYLNVLRENKSNIARTATEQEALLNYLRSYRLTTFGRDYPIDEDLPSEMQAGYVAMLFPELLPLEIKIILDKPSLRWIETEIENMQFELKATSEGLDVICLKQDF